MPVTLTVYTDLPINDLIQGAMQYNCTAVQNLNNENFISFRDMNGQFIYLRDNNNSRELYQRLTNLGYVIEAFVPVDFVAEGYSSKRRSIKKPRH